MKNTLTRSLAVGAAGVLTLLSIGPAAAADTVAQAEASAISAVVLGQAADSGTVRATHDGQSETVTGNTDPALPLGAGQDSVALGVLAQEATADVRDGEGVSRACAGVAGDGGSVAEIGDTGCLVPGDNASLTLASLGDLGSLLSLPAAPTPGDIGLPAGLLDQLTLPTPGAEDGGDTPLEPPVELPGTNEAPGADDLGDVLSPEDAPSVEDAPDAGQTDGAEGGAPEETDGSSLLDQSVAPQGEQDATEGGDQTAPEGVNETASFVQRVEIGDLPLDPTTLSDLLAGSGGDASFADLLGVLGAGGGNPFAGAFEGGLGDLTGAGLELRLGAIEAVCRADAGGAAGDSRITEADVVLTGLPTGDLVLATLPVNPEPNQKVVTDLSGVADDVLDGVRTDLNESLGGALAPLSGPVDQLQQQVVNAVLQPLEAQLAPLEENLLDITLNAQSSPEAGAIRVIALQAELLPAASDLGAPEVLNLAIGDVLCGPNSVVPTDAEGGPVPVPADIPTAVSAGEGGVLDGNGGLLVGGLLALAGAGALGGMAVRNRRA